MNSHLDLRGLDQPHVPDPAFVVRLERHLDQILAGEAPADDPSGDPSGDAPALTEWEHDELRPRHRHLVRASIAVAAAAVLLVALAVVVQREDGAEPSIESPSTLPTVPLPTVAAPSRTATVNGPVAFTARGVIYLAPGGEEPRPITVDGADAVGECPAFSPDGGRLMYARLPGHRPPGATTAALVVVSVRSDGSATPLSTTPLPTSRACASWAPGGRWAAYAADDSVWVVDTMTSEVRELPDHPGATDVEWRPGTDELAITGICCTVDGVYQIGGGNGPIHIYSASTGETRTIPGVEANRITWSPDGTTLALTQMDYETARAGDSGIWLVDADGANLRRLTQRARGPRNDPGIAWSPSGDSIAYRRVCEEDGPVDDRSSCAGTAPAEVVVVTVTDHDPNTPIGTETVIAAPVTDTGGGPTTWLPEAVTWAPDGAQLLFTTDRGLIAVPTDASQPPMLLTGDTPAPDCCPIVGEITWALAQQWGLAPGPTILDPGVYEIPKSGWSVADLTLTMPTGWTVQYGHVFHKHPDQPDEIALYPVVVDAIYADACAADPDDLLTVGDDRTLADALLRQTGAVTSGPTETTLGGYPAERVDISFPTDSDLSACSLGGDGLQIWYTTADGYFVLAPGGVASVYIVDVGGAQQVLVTQRRSATSPADVRELETILDTMSFEP